MPLRACRIIGFRSRIKSCFCFQTVAVGVIDECRELIVTVLWTEIGGAIIDRAMSKGCGIKGSHCIMAASVECDVIARAHHESFTDVLLYRKFVVAPWMTITSCIRSRPNPNESQWCENRVVKDP